MEIASATDVAARRQLVRLAVGVVLAMSTWFSTAAVLGSLREVWGLTDGAAGWLTIAVQLGFVVGAVVLAGTNLADRIPPRRLILLGALGAAASNLALVVAGGIGPAVVLRLLTGACLAAVYPPAMKVMSSWYVRGRGLALGVMVGALTLGSALPHLVNATGGIGWRTVLVVTSSLTVLGGLVADRFVSDGPHLVGGAVFDPAQIRSIVADRGFRLATAGYFGHMWELYAMWAWIGVFAADVVGAGRGASLVAFGAIGAGSIGAVVVGRLSDRVSRPGAAALAMRWSGAVALVAGFLVEAPDALVIAVVVVWGFWVVADSAQFSTIVTEVTDPRYVGTALTLQLASGFVLTVFTIFLVPLVRDAVGWGWAFALLAPGPAIGVWAMGRLRADSDTGSDAAAVAGA